jgi:hypothetical protein
MIFKDITVEEYILTEDKSLIDVILQNIRPKQSIALKYKDLYYKIQPRKKDLFEIEYKWIIKIKQNLSQANLNAVKEILSGMFPINTDQQFYNCSVFDVFAAYAWIVEEIENIYDVEKEKLHKKPTQKQIAAGIEEFDQLDDVPSIDGLANGDVSRWDEVLELPYGVVLRKTLLNKIQNDYNERYSKLK